MADSRISFSSGSRPPSRAHSEASNTTERPDSSSGPRTLSREIDHIKTLVSRAQNASSKSGLAGAVQGGSTITAQIFRKRSSSTPVTTAHILHELEQLKRRIKTEQVVVKRPPDADPETESEAEVEDGLDEREEALEKAREEVMVVRRHGEQLLESAESKVDGLTGERERLERSMKEYRDSLEQVTAEKSALEQQLWKAQRTVEDLASDVDQLRTSLSEHQSQVVEFQAEWHRSEASLEEAREQVAKLERLKSEMSTTLEANSSRIAKLEEENSQAAEQLRRIMDEHANNDSTLRKKLKEIQDKYDSIAIEAQRSQTSAQDLQKRLDDAEVLGSQIKTHHETRNRDLVGQIDQHKQSLEDALKDVEAHTKEFAELRKDRDERLARVDELSNQVDGYQVKLGAALYEHQHLEKAYKKQVDDAGLEHERYVQNLRETHAEEGKKAGDELSEVKRLHDQEIQSLKQQSESTKSEHEQAIRDLQEAHVEERKQAIDDLQGKHEGELASLKTSRAELEETLKQQHKGELDESSTNHSKELGNLRTSHANELSGRKDVHATELATIKAAHDQELCSLNDQLSDVKQQIEETNAAHAQEVKTTRDSIVDLETSITDREKTVESLKLALSASNTQISELQAQSAKLSSAAALGEEQSKAAEESHLSTIEELKGNHSKTLNELGVSHAAELERVRENARTAAEDHAGSISRLEEEHGNAINQTRADAEKILLKIKEEHAASSLKLQQDYATALEQANTDASTAQGNHNAALDTMKQESEERLLRLKTELDDLKASHTGEIQRLSSEHETALSQNSQNEIQSLKNVHAAQTREVEDQHTKTQKALHSAVEEAKQDAEVRLQNMKDAHDTRTRELEDQHAKDKDRLVADHATAMDAVRAEVHTDRDAVLNEAAQNADARLRDLEESHSRETTRMTVDHASELTKIKAAAQKDHNIALEHLRQDIEAQLRGLQDAHAQETERLSARHALSLSESNAEADRVREEALQQLHEEIEAYIQRAEIDHDKKIEQLVADHHVALKRSKEDATSRLRELEDEHGEERELMLAEHETAIDKIKSAAHEERERALNEAHQDKEREILELQRTHAEDLERSRAQHGETLSEARNDIDKRLAAVATEHEAGLTKVKQESVDNLQKLKDDHAGEVERLAVENGNSLRKAHEDAQNAQQLALETMRKDQDERQSEILKRRQAEYEELQTKLRSLQDEHQEQLKKAEQDRETAVLQLTAEHSSERETSRSEIEKQLQELRSAQDTRLQDIVAGHTQDMEEMSHTHWNALQGAEERYTSLEKAHLASLETLRNQRDEETRALLEAHSSHVADLKAEHTKDIENHNGVHSEALNRATETGKAYEAHLSTLREEHSANITALGGESDAKLAELRQMHEMALTERDVAWTTKADELAIKHQHALADASKQSDESTAAKLREVDEEHRRALTQAAEEAHADAKEKSRAAEQQYRSSLETAVERARQHGQAELRNLKKRHQDAVSQIRSNSQKQTAAQLSELEDIHKSELEASLEEARKDTEQQLQSINEVHQDDILRMGTEHQSGLADLESRIRAETDTHLSARQASFTAEVTALQERLDASLTGQAEAERSLAGLRQQLGQAERRIVEAKRSSNSEVIAVQQERDDLTSMLGKLQASFYELQAKVSSGAATPGNKDVREELASNKVQLDRLEREHATMQLTLQKRSDEKNELSRQNDFLVKELEALLSQRSRPRLPPSKKSDALVQTEPFVSEPKADLVSFQPIKQSRRKTLRPETPLSPGNRQAKDEIDMAWSSRSFEDYLRTAKIELSELGSVITANETLFAQKIQEHVGELQRAKDALAADYKARVDSLAVDKERMEKMVTSKQAAAFARERKHLVARYGADFDDPNEQAAMLTSLPVSQARALRTAEERLVKDYNKRIAKRKSQIALRHAEEFQTVTRAYDKNVSDLLNNQHKLEGDLSVDPIKFEQDLRDLESRSAHLKADKSRRAKSNSEIVVSEAVTPSDEDLETTPRASFDRRSRPRLATRTSNPRTARSIPRSSSVPRRSFRERSVSPEPVPDVPRAFYPGSRDDPGATSQPRKGSRGHPPVAQRSLLRVKDPMYEANQKRIVSDPLSNDRPITPRTPRTPKAASVRRDVEPAQDSDTAPAVVEATQPPPPLEKPIQRSESPPAHKPGFLRRIKNRISADGTRSYFPRPGSRGGSRPGSSKGRLSPTPETETPPSATASASSSAGLPRWNPKRTRSKKLSSGMIYYNAPPRPEPAKEYE